MHDYFGQMPCFQCSATPPSISQHTYCKVPEVNGNLDAVRAKKKLAVVTFFGRWLVASPHMYSVKTRQAGVIRSNIIQKVGHSSGVMEYV